MNRTEALSKMILPSMKRKGKPHDGVLQIHITRTCDKVCFNCTQGSQLAGPKEFMPVELFEAAVISLVDYFGIVGVFGGNPALHPQFDKLCSILRKYTPKNYCGIWCNKPFGKAGIMRETFNPAVSNLNVHLDEAAYTEFKRDWPESRPFGLYDDCAHSPCYVSPLDVGIPEEERWEQISSCDINQHWSAMIGMFRGQLRGWFCEIAGAQAMLKQNDPNYPDTGIPIGPGWWRKGWDAFGEQVDYHCHRCSVPYRGKGELAQALHGKEQCSQEYADIYKPKRTSRPVEIVELIGAIQPQSYNRMTDYMGNAKQ